jgi:D-alanine-D-alanine ligase
MKKKILIISGGISKERSISLKTGIQVAKELKKITIMLKFVSQTLNYRLKLKSLSLILYLMHCMANLEKMDTSKQY